MDKIDYVRDNEELYRSVRGKLEDKEYILNEGKLRILPKAFSDRHRTPSVDRAIFRTCLKNKREPIFGRLSYNLSPLWGFGCTVN